MNLIRYERAKPHRTAGAPASDDDEQLQLMQLLNEGVTPKTAQEPR